MLSNETLLEMAGGLDVDRTPEPTDINELAIRIETRIEKNREILAALPEYELGRAARNEVVSVDKIINDWNEA